jgi:2-polyprenyl-3-methyl-5-hydroxy-6-metoxy-1,4-benzoquinol methylase
VRWLRRLFDPHMRAVAAARRRFPGELLQPAGTTSEDRHPALFAELRRLLAEQTEPRLLSFGCSTGEEAFTLAHYLPRARIDGVDLNARAIATAQARAARAGTERITFAQAGTPDAADICYDAILCLSVLRHGDLDLLRPESCAAILPFTQVDSLLQRLDAVLKPGGLLAIWGSNFRFAEMAIAPRYTPLEVPGMRPEGAVIYGAVNQRLEIGRNDRFLFRKLT